MSVLFHADLADREFGSDLFSVAKLTAWAHSRGLEIQTVPPLDGFKFVQVEAFLCAVENAASETTTEEMAKAIVQTRPHLAQHRAAEVVPRWLVSADAHTQWRRMLEDAVKRRELTLLDFGSKLPVSPLNTSRAISETAFHEWVELESGTAEIEFQELPFLLADARMKPGNRPPDSTDTDAVVYHLAAMQFENELNRLADGGLVPLKNPLTGGAHTLPHGHARETAIIRVNDLREFLARHYAIGVRFKGEASQPNNGEQEESNVLEERLRLDAEELEAHKRGRLAEQAATGWYYLDEAAADITHQRGLDESFAESLLKRMKDAVTERLLEACDAVHKLPVPKGTPGCITQMVRREIVNKWLANTPAGYLWEAKKEVPAAPQEASAGKVWTEERKAEARAYRAQHGLKKTAEHYNVSQATISKHLPAGKAKTKKATPFGGLGWK